MKTAKELEIKFIVRSREGKQLRKEKGLSLEVQKVWRTQSDSIHTES